MKSMLPILAVLATNPAPQKLKMECVRVLDAKSGRADQGAFDVGKFDEGEERVVLTCVVVSGQKGGQ